MANYAKPLPLRARTVLLAVEGFSNVQIGNFIGFSDPTVRRWRRRYEEHGVEGLEDVQRPGKPPRIEEKTHIQALSRTGKDQPLEVLSGKLSANAF